MIIKITKIIGKILFGFWNLFINILIENMEIMEKNGKSTKRYRVSCAGIEYA